MSRGLSDPAPDHRLMLYILWTTSSFLRHALARTFLWSIARAGEDDAEEVMYLVVYSGILTVSQNVSHLLLVNGPVCRKRFTETFTLQFLITMGTNIGLSLTFASSVLLIKLTEPIVTSAVRRLVVGTSLPGGFLLSLVVTAGGAVVFTGNPFADVKLFLGMGAVCSSNIILALRTVWAEQSLSEQAGSPIHPRRDLVNLPKSSLMTMLVSGTIYLWRWVGLLPDHVVRLMLAVFLSAVFYVIDGDLASRVELGKRTERKRIVIESIHRLVVLSLLYWVDRGSAWSLRHVLALGLCSFGLVILVHVGDTPDAQSRATVKERESAETYGQWSLLILALALSAIAFVSLLLSGSSDASFSRIDFNLRHINPGGNTSQRVLGAKIDNRSRDYAVYSQTFTAQAYERPLDSDLEPDLSGYLKDFEREIRMFLKERLIFHPEKANFLSQKLRTHSEIIKEAQRLHFNILGDVLKKFKYAMLFDIAAFENKGDPCITVGEILFLSRIKLPLIYYCSTSSCAKMMSKARILASKYSMDELVILVHGGGNIVGYAMSDISRFNILNTFAGYQVFVFPQSIWVRDVRHPHFQRCVTHYCCNENLTLVLRDIQSYDIATTHFTGSSRLLMAPDMAFQIGHVDRITSPVFDVMWIKRKDGETPGYLSVPPHPPHLRVHVSDWWQWKTNPAPSSLEKAFYISVNGFFFLQRGRVIVTDRLHGHILATLMNIPHVIIDNRAKKLSSYHNTWTQSLDNTWLTSVPAQAMNLSVQLLETYKTHLPPRVPFLNISESFQRINFSKADFLTYV